MVKGSLCLGTPWIWPPPPHIASHKYQREICYYILVWYAAGYPALLSSKVFAYLWADIVLKTCAPITCPVADQSSAALLAFVEKFTFILYTQHFENWRRENLSGKIISIKITFATLWLNQKITSAICLYIIKKTYFLTYFSYLYFIYLFVLSFPLWFFRLLSYIFALWVWFMLFAVRISNLKWVECPCMFT